MLLLKTRYGPAPAPLKVVNGLMFNLSWFLVVYTHSAALALCIVCAHLALHGALLGFRRGELKLIGLVLAIGVLFDQVLFATGLLTVGGEAGAPPLWMFCLWPLLATTFLHAFEGLQSRLPLAAIFGAIGGAGAYIAGTGLSEIAFTAPLRDTAILAALWAIAFPLFLLLARALSAPEKDERF